ncbi:MAG: hypothetical protein IS860_07050 [Nitrosopumilus sp.]|nr:hypothetical protein [Nitrosopumilus sp.]
MMLADLYNFIRSSMNDLRILGIPIIFVLFFAINPVFAQTSNSEKSTEFSGDLLNDPIAQDILKKIEQTKKMIEELKQKEYEQNQAKENLEKMRSMSIESLNKKLAEWERLWEKYSSRNSFESFVNKKSSYVQDVFWDQFQFQEQRANAGKDAMNKVLINGGTFENAKNAYHNAASIQKIEMVEINAQSNVKHNLADYAEQQMFNSTGKIHPSAATQKSLASFYSDYKEQPSYILANYDDAGVSEIGSDTLCKEGFVLVTRVVSGNSSCVDDGLAEKWADNKVPGISISGNHPQPTHIKTNPGTQCETGHLVVYNIATSEYQCVLESVANEMIDSKTAEIHTLVEYVLDKDDQKIIADETYEINQKIFKLQAEYDLKRNKLESKYDTQIENVDLLAKQKMQDIIKGYKEDKNITKEKVSQLISEIRIASNQDKEKINKEKLIELETLESELKKSVQIIVKGYENNAKINVDWNSFNKQSVEISTSAEEKKTTPVKVVPLNENYQNMIYLDNYGLVNSFGYAFDEIKSEQVLQIASDITNIDSNPQDFIYMVEIKDQSDSVIQPAKWMRGMLNSNQTLNVGLSWIPEEAGKYTAIISVGTEIDSVLEMTSMEIDVHPEKIVSDNDYCKSGYDLLFKYTDNLPICVTHDTASKLINKGLAFA